MDSQNNSTPTVTTTEHHINTAGGTHPVALAFKRWSTLASVLPFLGANLNTIDALAPALQSNLPHLSLDKARNMLGAELIARAALADTIAHSYDNVTSGLESHVRTQLQAMGIVPDDGPTDDNVTLTSEEGMRALVESAMPKEIRRLSPSFSRFDPTTGRWS